jgi:4-amino-4-deoxychorismate lyase
MFRFFETIRIENGVFINIDYHFQRMIRTANDFGISRKLILKALENLSAKAFMPNKKFRCKLLYDYDGFDCEFTELENRTVASLKIVFDDLIDYSYKFSDRKMIESLYYNRQDCDDVLIVKNGQITDTSIANILLFDGCSWVTPDSPLLNGTCRQRLIDEGRVEVREVLFNDLKSYSSIMLINALRDFDEDAALLIETSIKL